MTDVNILNGGELKEGDTYPELRAQLMDGEDPYNLTDYSVDITIRRTDADENVVSDSVDTKISNRGIVEYEWGPTDTEESGTYYLEFVAEDGTDVVSFPNDGYARIYIEDKL
jgi:hypothetical protein